MNGNASVSGNLTIATGYITAGRDSSVYNGNDRAETAFSLNNSKVNGFSTYYMNSVNSSGTINQTGKLFTGQSVMCLTSTTDHSLKLGAGAGVVESQIEILGSGTRGVPIQTPTIIDSNLTVNGFISAKPFVSLRVITSGGTPSTGTTTGTIGTPGTVALTYFGFTTSVNVARGSVGNTNNFLYTFSWTTPHPLGANYIPMAIFRTTSTSEVSPNAFFTVTNSSSTSFTLWIRGATNILQDGNFFVYTVP